MILIPADSFSDHPSYPRIPCYIFHFIFMVSLIIFPQHAIMLL